MTQLNAIDAIALVAEQKILEALDRGQFDNLPGAGRPLVLEDLSHLPPEARMAYTVLKNSGYLEPDLPAGPFPETAMKRDNPEEGLACGRLKRLQLLMRRVVRSRGQEQGPACLPAFTDSPYLASLLKRV